MDAASHGQPDPNTPPHATPSHAAPTDAAPRPDDTLADKPTSGGVRVVAFMNQKGGVGKTTTAVNLGAALSANDARVLLIDMDPQAHLTLHVGINPDEVERSIYDLLMDDELSAEQVIQTVDERLDVLPAEVDLAGAESELMHRSDRQHLLKRKLSSVLNRYDYVMIDCPPSLGLLTLNALALAGEVVVPMQAQFLALQGMSKLLETVQLIRAGINPQLKVAGVVLCMHDSHTNLAREVVGDLEAFFARAADQNVPWKDARVYQPPIRRNIKLAECPSFGQTIFQYEPWCAGGRDYMALAESFAEGGVRQQATGNRQQVSEVGRSDHQLPGADDVTSL